MEAESIIAIAFIVGAAIGYLGFGQSIFLALVFGVAAIALVVWIASLQEKAEAKKQQAYEQQEALRIDNELKNNTWRFPKEIFFDKCRSKRLTNISTEEKYRRAKLLSEELLNDLDIDRCYHHRYTSREFLEVLFEEYDKKSKAERAAKNAEELKRLRTEERNYNQICTLYANLVGRNKSLKICQDQIQYYQNLLVACEKDEQAIRSGGNAIYLSGMKKEADWAIRGGIASGIAGAAAGVAVAMDTMNRNMKIREQNAALCSSVAQVAVMGLEQVWNEKRKAQDMLECWEAEEDELRTVLTQDMDEQMLLEKIHPSVVEYQTTKSGAVKIKCNFRRPRDLKFDGLDAVVDGAVKVLVQLDGNTVGTAICTLDYHGTWITHNTDCICTTVSKKAKKYEFAFEPYHLWAVEDRIPRASVH